MLLLCHKLRCRTTRVDEVLSIMSYRRAGALVTVEWGRYRVDYSGGFAGINTVLQFTLIIKWNVCNVH